MINRIVCIPKVTVKNINFSQYDLLIYVDLIEENRIENSPVRDGFANMVALVFVPVEEVERVWRTLKPLLPADMVSFISYFESTWVGNSTTSPLFSHDMWNQHDASLMLIPRSSNIAEGWHTGIMGSTQCCHVPTLDSGSFWAPLSWHGESSVSSRAMLAPKWIKYDQRLQKIADDFESYTNVLDYLEAVCNMTMLK